MAKKKKQLSDYWTLGTWHDMDNYECTECPFSSPDKQHITEHVIARHVPREPRKVVKQSPITDRYGNPIKKEVEVEETDGTTDEN